MNIFEKISLFLNGEDETEDISVLILTKSAKNGGFCVAGINKNNGKWIRLVSTDKKTDGALTEEQIRDDNGYPCFPLKLIKVRVYSSIKPPHFQKENMVLDTSFKSRFIRKGDILELSQYVSRTPYIFGNTRHCLEHDEMCFNGVSLGVFKVNNLHIYKSGKTKANFIYNNQEYNMISVTDPDYFCYSSNDIDEALIVVSLPNKDYEGKYYKFIAKIYEL